MKNRLISFFAPILILLILASIDVKAQLQVDRTYGFKINIPSNWSKSSHMDGTDKVYDYYSPDQNAAIQLRVFMADARITVDLLAQVNEQNLLPAGAKKLSLSNSTSSNGIPGKQGLYSMNYNGNEVNMAVFYTVQNGKGYVLTAIIPTSMLEQKGEEVKRITKSFVIDGFKAPIAKQDKKPSGLGGLMGGTSASNKQANQQDNSAFSGSGSGGMSGGSGNNNRLIGQYNKTHRADGLSIMYHETIILNANGTYVYKIQRGTDPHPGIKEGKWKLNGDVLILRQNNSDVYTYTVKDNFLYKTYDGKIESTFKKQ